VVQLVPSTKSGGKKAGAAWLCDVVKIRMVKIRMDTDNSFDKDLMYARSYAMGQEFKGKGAHIALSPMTNMGRVAAGGRNWEGFGGDPYLSGWATEMSVRGLQDAGVQAT
jgi:beta-glucosidase-like glycosyl hydrolase